MTNIESLIETLTETYTVADVKNVFEQVAGDLAMIARSTGLWGTDYLDTVIEDIYAFAEAEFLAVVDIVQRSESGGVIRAHKYTVNNKAWGWENSGPKGNIWPAANGGSLSVVLTYNDRWWGLSDLQRANFKAKRQVVWGRTDIDVAYSGLRASETSRYASRGFGVERRTFGISP